MTQRDYHQAKCPPVAHGVAVKFMAQVASWAEDIVSQHKGLAWEEWSNSTPQAGVRRLHVTFYVPGGYGWNQPAPEPLYKAWLSNVHSLAIMQGLSEHIKVHRFRGVWYVKIWYNSDGVVYRKRTPWEEHKTLWFVVQAAENPRWGPKLYTAPGSVDEAPVLHNPADKVLTKGYRYYGTAERMARKLEACAAETAPYI